MSNSPPTVSIGLPVYNSEQYLEQALDSLARQTYGDFELVISDNGSTDRTASICRTYATTDPRIRVFREERNQGASWNFNRVFALSRGQYFKWAAHDDLCAPTFLERCVAVLDSDPSIVCCHTKTAKIDAVGNRLPLPDPTDGGLDLSRPGRHPRFNARSTRADRRFRDVLLSSGWAVRCYGVIRSDALRQTGMLRPYYGYEKVLMAELSLLGRFFDVPETLFFQRLHADASSHLGSKAEQQAFFAAASGARSYPRLEYLRGYVRALRRLPISPVERLWCVLWIGRYLFQVGKWGRVVASVVRGTGPGGSHRELVERWTRQLAGRR